MLLSLVHAPPGPARELLRAVGAIPGVVHRSLESITGPDPVRIADIDPARVTAGDRTRGVLLRAAAIPDLASIPRDPPQLDGLPVRDVHVLAALVTHDEPCVAMLILDQLEVVPVLRGALGHLLDAAGAAEAQES